jgi:cell division protein FtsA
MGAGTTSLVVYEEKILLHTAVLPVGSSHITNDVAIGLRTSIDIAETIKVEHGTALSDEIKANETIVIATDESEQESASRKEVATIIRDRLEELFSFVDKELKQIGRSGLLPAGVVLTGGGAHLPGVVEVGKQRMRLPVRIGKPKELAGVIEQADDPSFAVVLGLIAWAIEQERKTLTRGSLRLPDIGNSIHKVRAWVRTFLP